MPSLPPTELVVEVLLKALLPALATAAAVMALVLLLGSRRLAVLGSPRSPDQRTASSFSRKPLASGVGTPALVRGARFDAMTSFASALALAAGLAAGNLFRGALPLIPEQAAWHWLPLTALAALAAGLLARLPHVPWFVGWPVRLAAVAFAAWMLVPNEFRAQAWWHLGAFAAGVLALWALLETVAERTPGGTVPLSLALAFLGGAVVILHGYSARLADIGLIAAAGLTGIALVAWWGQADVRGAMPGVAVLLPGLLLAGMWETADLTKVPRRSFVLIAVAPLAWALTLLPPRLRLPALLLVPVAYAVYLAMRAEPDAMNFNAEW